MMSMAFFKEIIAVLVGGAIGSLLRFLSSRAINEFMPKNYPWGIWVVNILGCFVMGIFAGLILHKYINSVFIRTLLTIGLLGGFTTFSSFSLDTLVLAQNNQIGLALVYVFSTLLLTLGAVSLGFYFVTLLNR